MTDTAKETSVREMGVGCRTAGLTAKVTGFFSIVFLALLVANFLGTSVFAVRRENQLAEMKVQLKAEGGSEEKLAEIRELDAKIRRDRLWRLAFARKTSFALLGSVVLFVIAGKLAHVLGRQSPRPQHASGLCNRLFVIWYML